MSLYRICFGVAVAIATLLAGSASVLADDQPLLDLVRVPLAVNAAIPPNVLVTLDDSGSMGWGRMPDSANWGNGDCRRFNSTYNRIYYDPNVVYDPPLDASGNPFPNSSFTAAWNDGFRTNRGVRNLARDYAFSRDHQGNTNYTGGWDTSGFPSGVSSGGRQRAFYCTGTTSSTVVLVTEQSDAVKQNFANWYSYYRIRSLAARTALSTAFAKLDPGARVAWQNFNNSSNRLNSNRDIQALDNPSWRADFFSWLHEPRFSGQTPMNTAFLRAGRYVENNRTQNTKNPYYDIKYGRELSCRQTFHVMMTDGYGNQWLGDEGIGDYDTPGQSIHDGRALTGDAALIYHNKAQADASNRRPGLADMAFYFWSRDLRPNLNNDVPAFVRNNTIEDAINANPADQVYFNPANDPATWQRMVNYMVTFGAGGNLTYSANTLMELRTGSRKWPQVTGGASTIDDAWHAAVNSRGDFLSADDPQELVSALTSIMENVTSRQAVTAVSGSSAFIRTGEYHFQASYDTNDWTGDITATPLEIGDSGVTAPPWPSSVAGHLDSLQDSQVLNQNQRKIISWSPSGDGPGDGNQIDFIWDQLSEEQQWLLRYNPDNGSISSETIGQRRLNYIRGEREHEQDNGGPFRSRESRLGAIVDSNIAYVEAPAHSYFSNPAFLEAGEPYAEFVEDHRARKPMLYVGANDGMLHAIEARTGKVVWSFVPNKVIRNLSRLSSPNFQFFPTVNGKLERHDVYINGAWKTVLFGTLGLGGQGAFAIDITHPDDPRILWEIGDEHVDGRLGYNYGHIAVARMKPTSASASGRWIAALPSGYNHNSSVDYSTRNMPNALPDLHSSEEGPALFIIDVETGEVVRTLDAFPNVTPPAFGLAEVTISEYGSAFEADFAIGGDLNGNLWRYSLSVEDSATDGRDRAQIERLLVGNPEYPVTAAPRVFPDLGNGLVIVGGTGKFLEPDDRERNITPQTVYGIQECLSCDSLEVRRSDLVEHELTHVGDGYLGFDRVDVIPTGKRGWFFDLGFHGEAGIDVRGERVLDRPRVMFELGLVFIDTYYPSDDPCSPLGGEVPYALNAYTGGYPFAQLSEDGEEWVPTAPPAISEDGESVPDKAVSLTCTGDLCESTGSDVIGFGEAVDPQTGCLLGTNICITPMRRSWRELPLE